MKTTLDTKDKIMKRIDPTELQAFYREHGIKPITGLFFRWDQDGNDQVMVGCCVVSAAYCIDQIKAGKITENRILHREGFNPTNVVAWANIALGEQYRSDVIKAFDGIDLTAKRPGVRDGMELRKLLLDSK